MHSPLQIKAFGNYNIVVEQDLTAFNKFLKQSNYSKYFVLVDENTAAHCLPILENEVNGITINIIKIKSGEQYKNFETLQYIIEQLITHQADRKALLINLGGGVICDMGAFAASIYKRGIQFVHLPSTLLSMVDASVGGKTGINFNSYKNQVGTFTNPQLVYANINFLKTLPERHLKNGFAEMLKHGYLSGNLLDSINIYECLNVTDKLPKLIFSSINFKNKIVTTDFNEKAERKQLNFGHTIGHAIESYSLKNDGEKAILHGEAISAGFVIEAILGIEKCDSDKKIMSKAYLDALVIKNLYKILPEMHHTLIELMKNDKKNNTGTIQFALLKNFGQPIWDVLVTEAEIKKAFIIYNQLINHAV